MTGVAAQQAARAVARAGAIGLVAATPRGRRLAAHLAATWPGARLYSERPGEAVRRAWGECSALLLVMATGAAVRLTAPLLADKRRDPGVVCVDDGARFAVVLSGGHGGGANDLAAAVSQTFGCTPVVTTASESLGVPALDALGADLGFRVDPASDVAAVGSALVSDERVTVVSDVRWPLPPLPSNVVRSRVPLAPCLLITDRLCAALPRPAVVYRPASLVVGVGCSRGVTASEILALVDKTLDDAGLSVASVARVATIEDKRTETGLIEAVGRRGWSLEFHTAARLSRIEVPHPSEAARRAVGTPSVAEAAALADAAELVVSKRKSRMVTVAVGRMRPRGRLHLVGIGPGDVGLVPPMAREALARSEVVIGLRRYLDAVRCLLRPGTRIEESVIGDEMGRARGAVAEARAGAAVALVSGGDAGIYAMASPALCLDPGDIDVVCVPGICAALAAASLLGAPLGHDHCSISLSNRLTPWELIRQRVHAAARADFVVVFYNPRSSGRGWQLEEARRLLLEHRASGTPVGVVTDAFRPGQRVAITTLGELDVGVVGMTTTVVVGSSQTRMACGRMVTPRGYS